MECKGSGQQVDVEGTAHCPNCGQEVPVEEGRIAKHDRPTA